MFRNRKTNLLVFVSTVILTLLLSACGSGLPIGTPPADMQDFKASQVRFFAKNMVNAEEVGDITMFMIGEQYMLAQVQVNTTQLYNNVSASINLDIEVVDGAGNLLGYPTCVGDNGTKLENPGKTGLGDFDTTQIKRFKCTLPDTQELWGQYTVPVVSNLFKTLEAPELAPTP